MHDDWSPNTYKNAQTASIHPLRTGLFPLRTQAFFGTASHRVLSKVCSVSYSVQNVGLHPFLRIGLCLFPSPVNCVGVVEIPATPDMLCCLHRKRMKISQLGPDKKEQGETRKKSKIGLCRPLQKKRCTTQNIIVYHRDAEEQTEAKCLGFNGKPDRHRKPRSEKRCCSQTGEEALQETKKKIHVH